MGSLVKAEDISVNMYPRAVCPALRIIVYSCFLQQCLDILFGNFLRDVNHLCCILYKAAILSLRSLVWTQPTPLRRVQISCLEVGLTSNKWACDSPHVRQCGQICCPIKELAHSRPPSDPVPCRKSMHNLGCEDVRTKARRYSQFPFSVVMSLQLVLQVSS